MNIVKTLIIFLSLFIGANSFAQEQKVESYSPSFLEALNAIDTIPTRLSLEKENSDASLLLESISCDEDLNSYTRNRAISFLSMFEKKGLNALQRLSSCDIPETQERAVYTLARTFPTDKKVIALVLSFDHVQAKTKAMWTVRALRWLPPERARPTLVKLSHSAKLDLSKLATKILK